MSKSRQFRRNYLKKAMPLLSQGERGKLNHIIIRHDDGCPALNGGAECTCNPDAELISDEEYQKRIANAARRTND